MNNRSDIFTLAHGSGGELTHQLLEDGIFTLFKNSMIQQRHDGAIVEMSGRVAFSTDSYVISPLFFPGGNIGELSINGTINDLAMCGAEAKYLSLSFIIEEGLSTKEYYSILTSINESATKTGVHIVTGDTKVVEKGKGDKIFINTSGIGSVHPKADIRISAIRENDKIIISGPIASHGMAIMSVRQGLEFESEIKSDTRCVHKEVLSIIEDFGEDIHFLRDPTRGGVATVLNEIAKQASIGIMVEENLIPITQDVQAACEILGIDPLNVANEGIFIAIVEESSSINVLKKLQKKFHCKYASIIGTIVREHEGKVVMHSNTGGRRIVPMPPGEQLPRIC